MRKSLSLLVVAIIFVNTIIAQKLPWAIALGNTTDNFTSAIGTDQSGNIIISGFFKGTDLDFDPSAIGTANLSSVGDNDIFVAKYNNAGQYLWAFSLGNVKNSTADKMTIDSAGNIYISGTFRDTMDFDPSPTNTYNLVSNGDIGTDPGFGGDAYLAKYSSTGAFLWAIHVGSISINDLGGAVTIDQNGDVLWSGAFTGKSDFDPSADSSFLTATGGFMNTFLAKYTPNGDFVWAKGFFGNITNTTGRDITEDKSGNIYFIGHYDGTIDLDPGVGIANFPSHGCEDFFLVKLTSNGQYLWGFNIGGTGCDFPWNMEMDSSNNIYITGFYSGSVDFNSGTGNNTLTSNSFSQDGFVAKYDQNGNYIFAGSIGGTEGDYAFGLILTNNGYTISGSFTGTADFDMGTNSYNLISSGGYDGFVARYDLNGKFENAFKLGGTGNEEARELTTYYDKNTYKSSVAYPFNENIYVSGRFSSANVDFDPSPSKLVYSTQGGDDMFIAKYIDLELVNYTKGTVFIDNNKNGIKDASENYTDRANILSYKSFGDTILTGALGGQFGFVRDTGSYTTQAIPYLAYHSAVPALYNNSSLSYSNIDSVDFALQPIPGQRDVTISILPYTPIRPGFGVGYALVYQNIGTDTIASGSVEFIKDNRLSFISSLPSQSSINGDTIRWTYNDLKPGDVSHIDIVLNASMPPIINIGDTLVNVVSIFPFATDLTPNDNISSIFQIASGSFDPNDKTEKHGGQIRIAQLSDGLEYTIRFQNTGNDTAFNIVIRDTLSSKLDWKSIQMVSASHPYKFKLLEGKFCEWTFSNIKLVDSIKNNSKSKGYLMFRIKATPLVVVGDTIKNRASIYFDYNAPIRTNVNSTIVVSDALPVKLLNFNVRKEGKKNLLDWATANEMNTSFFDIQRSQNGRNFSSIGKINTTGNTIFTRKYSFSDLDPVKAINYYRLGIMDKDGKLYYSPIRKVNNGFSMEVSAFPNPVNEKLQINIQSDKAKYLRVDLLNMNGKLLSSNKLTIIEGATNKTMDVSALSSGTYLVKIYDGEEYLVLKFQKQ